jgi:GT2 family glycosyltransferase
MCLNGSIAGSEAAVDFVVCTRNNRELIDRTLAAIARQTIPPAGCTVVDGLSTDGTPEHVRARAPWVDVIVKTCNSGPAMSRNLGAARGRSAWIAFVDSDVELAPDWTERQLALCRADPRIGVAGSTLVYAVRPTRVQSAYGVTNRFGVAWSGGVDDEFDAHARPRRCLWIATAAIMVPRELFERLGGFDEAMFGFHEDVDLGWRANLLGRHVVWNPQACALHAEHGTLNDLTLTHGGALYFVWRNRLRSLLVNYEAANLIRRALPLFVLSLADAVRAAPRAAKWRALFWNVRRLPDSLRRRRTVQRTRRVTDRDLADLFEAGITGPGYSLKRGARGDAPAPPARGDVECGYST